MKNKTLLAILIILICSSFSVFASSDENKINTTISYSKPNGTKVQGIIPQILTGEKLNIQISIDQKLRNNSIGRTLKNATSFFYDTEKKTKTVAAIWIHSSTHPKVLQYSGLEFINFGYDVDPDTYRNADNWICYTVAWDYRSKENINFDLQVDPNNADDYELFINFYKVKKCESLISLEDAFNKELATKLTESYQKYTFQVVL